MDHPTHIVGTATTPMQRRDLTIEAMSHQVVDHALVDAGLTPDQVDLVVFGNATAGRLLNQACIRGQSFLLDAGLRNAGIINVDNSCAGGASALHLASLAALGGAGTVLAVGVEKMWTGHRLETLAGIEDGVPEEDRQFMHANWENPSGSVLMALNAKWTVEHMEAWGTTVEQIGSAAVKARKHGALNPHAQFQSEVTLDEVLGSPVIVSPLTRLMCSRPGRVRRRSGRARCGRVTARSTTTTAWPRPPLPPGTRRGSTRPMSTSLNCTMPPVPRRSAPLSHSGYTSRATPGRQPKPVKPLWEARESRSTPAVAWSAGAIPSGRLASPRSSSSSPSCVTRPAPARSREPDWPWPPTPVA
jgi:hypothetical protein